MEYKTYKDWPFKASLRKEDAYYSDINQIQELSNDFINKDEEEKNLIVNKIIDIIRKNNNFPIIYFNEEGIKDEIKSVIDKDNVCFIDDALYTQAREGNLLLDFMFPNLHNAITCNESIPIFKRFYDNDLLFQCIKKYLSLEKKINNIRTLFFSVGRLYWDTPTNFSPIRAKAIFERFCPKDGIIYDYSSGFGGRMLGALSSKQNFHYIGTDPNTLTYNNLKILGEKIEDITKRNNSYKIYNLESEILSLPKNSVDLCFSCPPFFNKEIYTEEDTQSISKFPAYNDWLEKYVRPTIKNCYIALKEDGIFGFDIMNYYLSGKEIKLIEDWTRIAEEEGFIFYKSYEIASKVRKKESEKIYIFTKNGKEIKNYTPSLIYNTSVEHKNYLEKRKDRRYNVRIGEYDVFGKLIQVYNKDESDVDIYYVKSRILKKDDKYYVIYRGDDLIKTEIEVKNPLAKISDKYFYSYSDIGRFLKISRQAVQQSKKRNSKTICGNEVLWYDEKL